MQLRVGRKMAPHVGQTYSCVPVCEQDESAGLLDNNN